MACGGCGNRKPIRSARSDKVAARPVAVKPITVVRSTHIQRAGVRKGRA